MRDTTKKRAMALVFGIVLLFSALLPVAASGTDSPSSSDTVNAAGSAVWKGNIIGYDIEAEFFERYAEVSAGSLEETEAFIADFVSAYDIDTEGLCYLILNSGWCRLPYMGLTADEALSFFETEGG